MPTAKPAIKFCGLTRERDVETALELGVDYLGLVLAAGSPRRIAPGRAAALAALAHGSEAKVVLLFRDAGPDEIDAAVAAVRPDLLQFHGSESEAECRRSGLPYWKALGVSGAMPGGKALAHAYPDAEALLLDAHPPGAAGGTGERLDWHRWPRLARPLVLAGGLEPDNVAGAIVLTRPYAVDVSSGIESAPGLKDAGRMQAFVAAVRGAG